PMGSKRVSLIFRVPDASSRGGNPVPLDATAARAMTSGAIGSLIVPLPELTPHWPLLPARPERGSRTSRRPPTASSGKPSQLEHFLKNPPIAPTVHHVVQPACSLKSQFPCHFTPSAVQRRRQLTKHALTP